MLHLILTVILIIVVYAFGFVALALQALASQNLSMFLEVLGNRTWLELVWVAVCCAGSSWCILQPRDTEM